MNDNIIAKEKWVFDEGVTKCFANMLARSIPGYEQMRELTVDVSDKFLKKGKVSIVADIGCSNGLGIEPFLKKYGASIRAWLADVSEPMTEDAKKRLQGWVESDIVHVECLDIIDEYPKTCADLTLLTLALQFTPIQERQQILRKVYEHTRKGGGVILVQKVQGECAETDDMLTNLYYNIKRGNGYSEQQIMTKRKSLRGVLVPLKPKWNQELLEGAGFRNVQMFWRHLNFCAWVAERD